MMEVHRGERQGVHMVDCTLREGMQMPGVEFSREDMMTLALALDQSGVALADAGMPAAGHGIRGFLTDASAECERMRVGASVRCLDSEVNLALECGVHSIFVICPISAIHLRQRLRLTPDELFSRIENVARMAMSAGVEMELVAEDSSRADLDLVRQLVSVAANCNVKRVFLADTVGCRTPAQFGALVRDVITHANGCVDVGVHCHNDLGLATANTVAAIEEGATWPTATVNGIGERAGNASLAEVAAATELLLGRETAFNLLSVPALSRQVEEATGVFVPPTMPLVGRNAFRHESGIHVDGLLKDPHTYEAVSPSLVDRTREFVIGKQSGRALLRALAKNLGISLCQSQLDRLSEALPQMTAPYDREKFVALRDQLRGEFEHSNLIPMAAFEEAARAVASADQPPTPEPESSRREKA